MNDSIQDWINGLAGHVKILDLTMKLTAADVIYLAPLLLIALWFWPGSRGERALNQRVAAGTFFGVLFALGLAALLGMVHPEARPFVTDAPTKLLIHHSADNSFPSDHATLAFALGGTIIWWRRLLGAACLVAAVLVAIARVYVGVHWPSDVAAAAIAGLFAGGLAAFVLVPLLEWPQRWFSRILPSFLIAAPD